MIGRVIIAQVYRATLQGLFNVVFNLYHYIRLLRSGKIARAKYDCNMETLNACQDIMPPMVYAYDGLTKKVGALGKWPCWTAARVVFAGMGFRGNCMDGAYFMACATHGRVYVWIPGPDAYSWYKWPAHVHYACLSGLGIVYSLERSGLKKYASLAKCRKGGKWI